MLKGKYKRKAPPTFLITKIPYNKYKHVGEKKIRHTVSTLRLQI